MLLSASRLAPEVYTIRVLFLSKVPEKEISIGRGKGMGNLKVGGGGEG